MPDIIIDKSILLLLCLIGLTQSGITTVSVMVLLAAVTVSSLCSALENNHARYTLLCLYSAALFLRPDFFLFLPLLVYDYLETLSPGASRGSLFAADRCLRALPPFLTAAALLSFLLFPDKLLAASTDTQLSRTALLICVQSLLSGLLRLRTNRCDALHKKLLRTRDDDTEIKLLLEQRNRSLLEKQNADIYSATLQERNRIAREIHDNVGHMITRAILMVGALRTLHPEAAPDGPLGQLGDTLNQAMNAIRSSVHDLHDSSLNLGEALRAATKEFTFCPVSLEFDMSPELPREICYSFIAIVRESLVNTAKHSNATAVTIKAIEHPAFYQLIICDNGTTCDCSCPDNLDFLPGIGLKNMQNRIQTLHGTFTLRTRNGFCIYITVPK